MSILSREHILVHVGSTSSDEWSYRSSKSHRCIDLRDNPIRFTHSLRLGARHNAWNDPAGATPRSLKIVAEPSIAARIANSAEAGRGSGAAQALERLLLPDLRGKARAALMGAAEISDFCANGCWPSYSAEAVRCYRPTHMHMRAASAAPDLANLSRSKIRAHIAWSFRKNAHHASKINGLRRKSVSWGPLRQNGKLNGGGYLAMLIVIVGFPGEDQNSD
jgi:hypothetical protein